MRCFACNHILTPAEAVRKFSSGVFTELCTRCLSTIDDDVVVQEDFGDTPEVDDDGSVST